MNTNTICTVSEIELKINNLFSTVNSNEDFPLVYQTAEELKNLCKRNVITDQEVHSYLKSNDASFLENSLIGHSLRKPYGYTGDFEFINKVYDKSITSIPQFQLWDKFIQSLACSTAVRNRRAYFSELVSSLFNDQEKFSILNLASGPARDLLDVYTQTEDSERLYTTCIDMDPEAIKFGKKVNAEYSNQIEFIGRNIFRFQTEEKFDLIWSAGLFDYFDDKTFIRLMKRIKQWIKPGGSIVIGNFNEDNNPSRWVMELFGDWYLHHRTEVQLTNLAIEAGFNRVSVSIGRENQNINLFLTIRA